MEFNLYLVQDYYKKREAIASLFYFRLLLNYSIITFFLTDETLDLTSIIYTPFDNPLVLSFVVVPLLTFLLNTFCPDRLYTSTLFINSA